MFHDPSAPPSTFCVFVRIHSVDILVLWVEGEVQDSKLLADNADDSGAADTWSSLRVTAQPWSETSSACPGQSS